MTSDDERRRAYIAYHRRVDKIYDEYSDSDRFWEAPKAFHPLPDELRGLSCGARTRAGTPCKMTALYQCGRCKLHGGLSTGPRTEAGKSIAARNGNRPKAKRSP